MLTELRTTALTLRTFPVLAALAIASLVGADASAAATKKPAPRPVGSVKLPSAKIKRVVDMGGFAVRCGLVGKAWQSGSVLKGGYFITDSQQVKNYTLAAKKLKSKKTKAAKQKRAKYLKRAKYFKVLVSAGQPACKRALTPTPTNALRFSIANKSGLALKSGGQASSARARPGARTATVGSNLQAIAPDGAITDAVASGAATVSKFLIAPNGKVYVLFSGQTNLTDTSSCLLAEVAPASGLPVCIDSTLQITWNTVNYWGNPAAPAVQFDAAGGIYYLGQVSGKTVLRRYRDGVITDLVNDNITINDFMVLPEGSVIISGMTASTGVSWTRRLDAGGSLSTLLPNAASGLYRFSDGNVYMGSWNGPSYSGVFRFLTGTSLMDPLPWTSYPAGVGSSHIDTSLACGGPKRQGFCNAQGAFSQAHFGMTDNKDFIIAGNRGQSPNLVQLYPTLSFPTITIENLSVAQQVGTGLILAGTNSSAKNIMTLYNTSNDVETPLLGADNEIEIYHINFAAGENKVLFDGLRFSDNKYVLGQVDLATREASVTTTIAAKWSDFQTFR